MSDTSPILPPAHQPEHQPAATRPPRRGLFAAGVLSGALVLGGGAGVAGAAAWQEWSPQGADTSDTSPTATTVVDRGDTPAAAGSVEEVAAAVLPSVVKIDVVGAQGAGSGSGIVLDDEGNILTNNHVVEVADGGGKIAVSFSDGTSTPATVVGTDALTDTAVIRAEDPSGLQPATIGVSGNLDVGQEVVAIGSPYGLDSTVTSGIVSALDRPVNVGTDSDGNATTYPAIQTDAAINPGNSGGPLVDMFGDVVGINSSIRTSSGSMSEEGGSIGLGFAIPIDEVMPIIDQMLAGDTPTHARLGISVSNVGAVDVQPGTNVLPSTEGAEIQAVTEGSIASDSGLQKGDVITRIDDHVITGADSLVATVRSYRPGDEVTVTYTRDGESSETTLELDSDG